MLNTVELSFFRVRRARERRDASASFAFSKFDGIVPNPNVAARARAARLSDLIEETFGNIWIHAKHMAIIVELFCCAGDLRICALSYSFTSLYSFALLSSLFFCSSSFPHFLLCLALPCSPLLSLVLPCSPLFSLVLPCSPLPQAATLKLSTLEVTGLEQYICALISTCVGFFFCFLKSVVLRWFLLFLCVQGGRVCFSSPTSCGHSQHRFGAAGTGARRDCVPLLSCGLALRFQPHEARGILQVGHHFIAQTLVVNQVSQSEHGRARRASCFEDAG